MTVKTALTKWINPPSICAQNVSPSSRNRVLLPCPLPASMQLGEDWTGCCSPAK